ncbi:MAG: BrnT family toxin [bacterium]|nr:BrnT family toxin [bacterium]
MQIEWDEEKRQENIRIHGFDFVGAEAIFDGDTLTIEDTRRDYGERRWVTVGMFEGRLVVLVHTERGDVIRPISLRKATRYERRTYFSQISH